jgi:hypothetical protein
MGLVSCSQCWGEKEYRMPCGTRCMECNGIGFFPHWREGRTREQVERDLAACKEIAAQGGEWAEYWAWYVQLYARELFELD